MHRDEIAAHITAQDEPWASLTSCHLMIIDPFLIYIRRERRSTSRPSQTEHLGFLALLRLLAPWGQETDPFSPRPSVCPRLVIISNVGKALDIFRVMMHTSPLENKVRYDVEYLLKPTLLVRGIRSRLYQNKRSV